MRDHWTERDLPILVALGEAESRRARVTVPTLVTDTGLDEEDVLRGLDALQAEGYATGNPVRAGGVDYPIKFARPAITGAGRRVVGSWPSGDALTELVAVLNRMLDNEQDPAARTRLERLRDAATAVGTGTMTTVLGAVATRVAGI